MELPELAFDFDIKLPGEESTKPYGQPESPKQDTFSPGVYYSCYICGKPVSTFQPGTVRAYEYQKEQSKEEWRNNIIPGKYVLTYCDWCYKHHIKP